MTQIGSKSAPPRATVPHVYGQGIAEIGKANLPLITLMNADRKQKRTAEGCGATCAWIKDRRNRKSKNLPLMNDDERRSKARAHRRGRRCHMCMDKGWCTVYGPGIAELYSVLSCQEIHLSQKGKAQLTAAPSVDTADGIISPRPPRAPYCWLASGPACGLRP